LNKPITVSASARYRTRRPRSRRGAGDRQDAADRQDAVDRLDTEPNFGAIAEMAAHWDEVRHLLADQSHGPFTDRRTESMRSGFCRRSKHSQSGAS
jgi:hypothetical protein